MPLSRDTLVGFACGHVFHLTCLLPKTSASASVAAGLQQQLAADAQESGGRWTRSVGAKVAHAHVIKSAVGRGCVVCREQDGCVPRWITYCIIRRQVEDLRPCSIVLGALEASCVDTSIWKH